MTRPVLLDCDPGIDDMVAILIAVASPEVELVGVTTVGGNVGIDTTTRNALDVLALAGRADIPVARGADRPYLRSLADRAESVHGDNGLGGVTLPTSGADPVDATALELIVETVRAATEPVTLVATGPLTNVAHLFAVHPAVASRLARLVVMGGSIGAGNRTPAAEFNIWADPEAAYRVLTEPGLPRPVPTTLVGLDVTYRTAYGPDDLRRLRSAGAVASLCADALDGYLSAYRRDHGMDVVPLHDPLAMAEAIRPGLVTADPAHVEVDTTTGPSRGNTLVDLRGLLRQPTAEMAVDVDVPSALEFITSRLESLGPRAAADAGL
ncbi:nucleoside hydrolase [Micromonospora sp. CPCC 205539]|uniref:nucleoside hydrolase n=1 Tax=Micromonospora sp. CPCC 205539 TaxID=3122408 RepID=UPI002FF028D3